MYRLRESEAPGGECDICQEQHVATIWFIISEGTILGDNDRSVAACERCLLTLASALCPTTGEGSERRDLYHAFDQIPFKPGR